MNLFDKDMPIFAITPRDLCYKPLIISRQRNSAGSLTSWIEKEISELEIVATYNLLFNASLMVGEGLGYAIGFDKIINPYFRQQQSLFPLSPGKEAEMNAIWKKYQVFSKASGKFMMKLKELSKNMMTKLNVP